MTVYVKGSRASIMTTNLEIIVLCKEQFTGIVQWLVDKEYNFEYEKILTDTSEKYVLNIYDISWMNNVVEIAQELQKYDYSLED